jgi:phosphoribosylanthranilate isomerase
MKIKICGVTSVQDALRAVEAGADLLGFNFYPASPRYITPVECARLCSDLERRCVRVLRVGVFVNAPPEEILQILAGCGLDLAQLSGDEPREYLEALGGRAFKALRPRESFSAYQEARRYARPTPPALLVDAHRPGQYGGTGQTGDWELAADLAREYPLLLAGGLQPGNVQSAIRQVHPWGVDVASGVECHPGRKDPQKMRAFICAVREIEKEAENDR